MGTLVGIGILAIVVIAVIAVLVVTRPARRRPRDEVRMREHARLRRQNASAQGTIRALGDVLTRYSLTTTFDPVGDALVYELIQLIRSHDQKMMEIDR